MRNLIFSILFVWSLYLSFNLGFVGGLNRATQMYQGQVKYGQILWYEFGMPIRAIFPCDWPEALKLL